MKRKRGEPTVTNGRVLAHGGVGVVALLAPGGALPGPAIDCQPVRLLAHVRAAREWPRFHRFVALSGLGWTFVLTAVVWELFAVMFSECAGWGWDKGAFFFAWGLGVLALGFYLRSSRQRPAVSRLFLGMNVLVLSVLSLVVATR